VRIRRTTRPGASHHPISMKPQLTEVTAEERRVPRSDAVHLSVTGLLPRGAPVLVYDGLRATHRSLGAVLAPARTIPRTGLRYAATEWEVRA
jgi:hypothetical protein